MQKKLLASRVTSAVVRSSAYLYVRSSRLTMHPHAASEFLATMCRLHRYGELKACAISPSSNGRALSKLFGLEKYKSKAGGGGMVRELESSTRTKVWECCGFTLCLRSYVAEPSQTEILRSFRAASVSLIRLRNMCVPPWFLRANPSQQAVTDFVVCGATLFISRRHGGALTINEKRLAAYYKNSPLKP